MKTTLAGVVFATLLAACSSLAPHGGPQRSDDLFSRIHPGMTQEQVRGLLGAPDDSMYYPLSHHTGWGYEYYDTWGYLAEFSVTFAEDGHAVSKISRRINDGGDHGGK